jgi:hypothetical protein
MNHKIQMLTKAKMLNIKLVMLYFPYNEYSELGIGSNITQGSNDANERTKQSK